jgi:hypothetical protein
MEKASKKERGVRADMKRADRRQTRKNVTIFGENKRKGGKEWFLDENTPPPLPMKGQAVLSNKM